MNRRRTRIANAIVAVPIFAAATIVFGRVAFTRRISREIDRLLAGVVATKTNPVSDADLTELPEPVQRWLRYAGVVGTPRPVVVRLKQEGELRLGDKGWIPFTAEQYYRLDPPGFIWEANATMSPLLTIVGRDSFVDGRGSIDMRLLGVVPVAKQSGPDLDRGALMRYLNEIMFFPAGAISPYITWERIDTSSARATLNDRGLSATATFVFDDQGRLTTMVAERYDGEVGAVRPWSTPISAYGELGGMRVPIAGEAVYARETGDYPYIRIRITALEYNNPKRY